MLGVGLAWLLGWSSDITSGQMTGADDDNKNKINWEDHCLKYENGEQIADKAIKYDANPKCSEMKFKEGDVFDGHKPSSYYVDMWLRLLKLGLLSDYDTKRIATMMNKCRRIHSLDAKTCPNDLEKGSLLLAIESAINGFEKGYAISQRYIVELEKLTKSTAGKDALSSRGSLDLSQYKDLHNDVRYLIQTYSIFYVFYFPVLSFDWAKYSNKKAFETWKPLIKNSTVSNIDLCAQKQLRHFLYEILRLQLMLSSLSNFSNTPLSAYPNITISNDEQKYIDDILKLNIAAMIKSMPADEAAEKVREKLSHSIGLEDKYKSAFEQPGYINRLDREFDEAYNNSMDQVTAKTIKQLIDDLKEVSKWFKPLLDKIKKLQAQFKSQLTNTTTASTIHECVEYLTTNATTDTPHNTMSSSASSLKSSWMPNSPILHILISSLFWARLAHLLELSH
ncbi:hypothetical protein NEHOM01_2506 [Nematocida homosporus]|uniref:uncharacterized protein n=1 Tax=Nematocida homosporus TaxID=1912981 RepID=UPI002220AE4E|nr:uncharacterized protein NEHOM01_2506 [Nematocida homosporus]KAI5188046.1 hypothetical protein NEHOM01_2506 [Nematocida homosporus]